MTRRGFIKGLLAVTLAGLVVSLHGFFIEPAMRLRVRKWKLKRADWTAPPLRIAVIADLHAGEPFVTLKRIRQVVRRKNALDADLVLLLGDFTASHRMVSKPVAMADITSVLAGLTARHGVFAVLGNHDWWDDTAAQGRGGGPNLYADALAANGIPVLSNSAQKLDDPGIWLAGLEDQLAIVEGNGRYRGLDDLSGTLRQITDDAPVVLMAHEPDIFPQVPDRVALTLSGHTHGGQIRLFGWSPVVPSRFGNRYAYGPVREGGKDMVISGGIGCSILPVRFGVTPEITLVEISA
ncbi:metallophosphoesterase [Ruegeria arenilitoris]|uniref:Putative metallophosphoesterase n=1 Tax=Ruegeria arenilitoris TaxID=1173585 RepID=A0A238JYV2_9RHOB|nr:metallophosphoesterase [Ruegeria arenilitoris]SMX35367.1 putative metallophosphoesterase [Ruegeria arenilitoris]